MKKTYLNKIINILILVMMTVSLTACSNAIPEMSSSQQEAVCRYAADLLLKYDANYSSDIMDDEDIQKQCEKMEKMAAIQKENLEEQAAKEKDKEKEKEDSGNDNLSGSDKPAEPPYTDIDEFLGLDGLTVEYSGCEVTYSYPSSVSDNDWQGICYAGNGNVLVVFSFDITNETGADYYLDMASLDTRFTFSVNSLVTKSALTTLLFNDFILYRGMIGAGETIENVIIIEMPEEDAYNISSILMKMKLDGNIAETQLL